MGLLKGLFGSHNYREMELNVTAGTAINTGDLLWYNGTTLKPIGGSASNLVAAWSSLKQARRNVTPRFAGVANFSTDSNLKHDKTFSVQSGGVYELPCASFTPKLGDLVGFAQSGANNWLDASKVIRVQHPADAIGIVNKDYSAATTTVQAILFSAWDPTFSLRSLIRTLAFPVSPTLFAAGGDIVTNLTFETLVRLIKIWARVDTLTAGASIVSLLKGATTLQQTLTIPSASAVGVVVMQDLDHATDDAAGNLFIDYGDALDLACDATPTAGDVTVYLDFYHCPLLG